MAFTREMLESDKYKITTRTCISVLEESRYACWRKRNPRLDFSFLANWIRLSITVFRRTVRIHSAKLEKCRKREREMEMEEGISSSDTCSRTYPRSRLKPVRSYTAVNLLLLTSRRSHEMWCLGLGRSRLLNGNKSCVRSSSRGRRASELPRACHHQVNVTRRQVVTLVPCRKRQRDLFGVEQPARESPIKERERERERERKRRNG